jgi:GT2 family glycosyltransferase
LIQSVKRIEYPNLEVIVIDDCSTDGTIDAVHSLDFHTTAIRTERSLGSSAARNLGLKRARGDYALFLDDDMIVSENLVHVFLSVAHKYGASIVGPMTCDYFRPDRVLGIGHDISFSTGRIIGIGTGKDCGRFSQPIEVPMVGTNGMFVRREVAERLGGFDLVLSQPYEDSDFCFRARKLGYRVFYAAGARIWEKNVSRRLRAKYDLLALMALPNYKKAFYAGRNKVIFILRHGSRKAYLFLFSFLPLYLLAVSLLSLLLVRGEVGRGYWKGTRSGIVLALHAKTRTP